MFNASLRHAYCILLRSCFCQFLTTAVRNVCQATSTLFSSLPLLVLGKKNLVMDKPNS